MINLTKSLNIIKIYYASLDGMQRGIFMYDRKKGFAIMQA